MYSRPQNRDIRVPHNYGGSIFGGERTQPSTPVKDLTKRRYEPPHVVRYVEETPAEEPPTHIFTEEREQDAEDLREEHREEHCEDCHKEREEKKNDIGEERPHSLFSPFGALGTEEILLIALALIIFQSGTDSELALILLALLFIQ